MIDDRLGKFGVIVGIDGSGKSTILRGLSQRGISVADWRDLRDYDEVAHLAPSQPRELRRKLKPMSRAMFVGAHLAAEYEYLVAPNCANGNSILLDSYYFKWFAKETIYRKTAPLFFTICSSLPKPDFLILLSIPPDVAFQRKNGVISQFEYYSTPDRDDFIQFQSRVIEIIMDSANGIPVEEVNANQEPSLVESEVLDVLRRLGWRLPPVVR